MNIDRTSFLPENLFLMSIPCTIVLCLPEESRNIGSVCRAMKNMDCHDLRIVGEKEGYSEKQVRTLALHAADIWESAQFFEPSIDGLKAAIADCTIAAGTTRRMGKKRKSWGMTPEQFAGYINRTAERNVAVVFGNERTGLTDEQLDCCSLAVNIPSSNAFPSLNLSHAVQIVVYSLFREYDARSRGYQPITVERTNALVSSISTSIDQIGLFKKAGRDDNEIFLSDILTRAGLSEREAQRLEKLIRKVAYIKTGYCPDK